MVPLVCALTSENRDVWADARKILFKACPTNLNTFAEIDAASIIVCLDDASPVTLKERLLSYGHGDGASRWFDKHCQSIINENGTVDLIGEHIMMDFTPTHLLNDLY